MKFLYVEVLLQVVNELLVSGDYVGLLVFVDLVGWFVTSEGLF